MIPKIAKHESIFFKLYLEVWSDCRQLRHPEACPPFHRVCNLAEHDGYLSVSLPIPFPSEDRGLILLLVSVGRSATADLLARQHPGPNLFPLLRRRRRIGIRAGLLFRGSSRM